jgi:hypothetical protein
LVWAGRVGERCAREGAPWTCMSPVREHRARGVCVARGATHEAGGVGAPC